MHGSEGRAACSQVDAVSLQLSGTGPCKHEARAPGLLHELVYDRQQLGDSLHFVDDDFASAGRSCNQFAQPFGPGGVESLLRRGEEVDPKGIPTGAPQLCALSGAPRAKKEEMTFRRAKEFPFDRHISARYGNSSSNLPSKAFLKAFDIEIPVGSRIPGLRVPRRDEPNSCESSSPTSLCGHPAGRAKPDLARVPNRPLDQTTPRSFVILPTFP